VEEASAFGTPETCRRKVTEFEDAGVDELIFLHTEPSVQRLEEFYKQVVSR
jgi:alkanesulfonate monooxygenase SsuD/methylene tetrahydromethanopterin reductase-like flavin-dependent oxidoreductase (luciferase family)